MTTATVQLPVLFDVSGTATVFGESAATADFISPHLNFTLDMTTEANDISLNAAHIQNAIAVGDHEISDTIYYAQDKTGASIDLLANRIAKAITRGKLVHVAPTSGDHSDSGIPMGGRPLVAANGLVDAVTPANNQFALKYRTSIAPVNDEQMMGEAMARVAAVHLVGHPLAQAVFKNESTIQSDLETTSGSNFVQNGVSTSFYNTFATQLSKVLGGALCSTPLNNKVLAPSGQIGEALFEGVSNVGGVQAPAGTTTYVVTVVNSGGNKFAIDGVTTPILTMVRGSTYIFDQADATNDNHVIQISATAAGANVAYATLTGTAGQAGAKTTVVVPHNAPGYLYYNCTAHGAGMGKSINIVDAGGSGNANNLIDVSGSIAGVAAASAGVIVSNPDVSGNIGSTSSLYSGDAAATPAGPVYIHDLKAQSFGGEDTLSMTFWLRTSGVDASLNIADNQTIFQSLNLADNAHNVKLMLRSDASPDDRIAVLDNRATAQISVLKINGVAKTFAHNQGNSVQVAPAVTKAELSAGTDLPAGGKWNHFYVEFATDGKPEVISWLADRASARTNPLVGSYLDEVHYFNRALTVAEIAAMKSYQSSQLKSNGIELPAVKSMFEQLMNIPGRALDMDSAIEVTGLAAEGARTSTVGMPIKTGDKVVVYIRPKVEFAFEAVDVTANNILGFAGNSLDANNTTVKDISGLVTAGATASTISTVFPGRANAGQAAEANTYGWMGSPNATMIGQESTNITAVNTMDQHIWKIEISL